MFALVTVLTMMQCNRSYVTVFCFPPFKMAGRARFCVCQCFFSRNIFLKSYECHVVFENEQQFQNDYKRVGSNLLSFLNLYAALIKGLEPGLWGQVNMFQFVLSGTSPKRLQDRRAMGECKEAGNFN